MNWFKKLFFSDDSKKDKTENIAEKIAEEIINNDESPEEILAKNKQAIKTMDNPKPTGRTYECEFGCGIPIEEGVHVYRTYSGKKYHKQCLKELNKMAIKATLS